MRKGSAVVMVAIVVLVFAGCSGDDGMDADRPDATPTSEVNVEQPTPTATPQLLPTPTPTGRYTVQAGDTLSGIARTFDVSVDELVAANDIDNPNNISVGQELQIPTPASSGG